MSNTKHNLLHLLKIVSAPIYFLLSVLTVGLFVFSCFLEVIGFRCDLIQIDTTSWWENLP